MGNWSTRKLSDFLKPYRIEHIVQDDINYRQVTISKNHGISFRGAKLGKNIGRKRQFIIDLKKHSNTILFTRQGVLDGAIGIAPPEVDECIVTENMPMMSVDTDVIEMAYLKKLLLSDYLYEKIRLLTVVGSAQKSIHERDLLNIEIQIPSIAIQQITNKKFNTLDTEHEYLESELTHQQTLLKKLRQQILQEAIEGKLTADWRDQNTPPLTRGGAEGGGVGGGGSGVKKLNNLPQLKTFRKSLRKRLTPAEAKLWTLLKGKQLQGRKFRRQHSVVNYILDFYCPSEKLAIELDGEVHNSPQAEEYDRERDVFLAHTGIKVLRFENKFVFQAPEGLLAKVAGEFENLSAPDPSAPAGHLPLSGEESLRSPPDKGEYREAGRGFEPASELLARIQAEKAQLIKDKKIKKQKPLPPISEEKPFELPDGWVWCQLDSIIYESPRNGYSPKTVDFPTATKTLKLGATTTGKFIDSETKYINQETPKDSFLWLKKRDILIQRGNSIDFVGVSAIYNGEDHQFVYPDLMMKLKPSESISEVYLHHALMSPYCREYFRDNATGAQKSMPKINQGVVSGTLIPFCSQMEQKAIVAKVEKLLALCDQLQSQITDNQHHAEQLMQAVLKEAFSQA